MENNKSPIQEGLDILVKKINEHVENNYPSNNFDYLDIAIKSIIGFNKNLIGLENLLKICIRNSNSKKILPEIIKIIQNESFLIKDKPNLIALPFLSTYSELSQKNINEAIHDLYITLDNNYPISENDIINSLQKNNYLIQRTQINKLIDIITNIINLLMTNGVEQAIIVSDKFESILSELKINATQLNIKNNIYLNEIVKQVELILEEQFFLEDDINYLISMSGLLSTFLLMDFYLISNEFINNDLLSLIKREEQINLPDFYFFISHEKINLRTKLKYNLKNIINNALDDLKYNFENEMQVHSFDEADTLANINSLENKDFLSEINGVINKINYFNVVYQNKNWDILYNLLISKINSNSDMPIGFWIESLLIIPELFINNCTLLQNFSDKWGALLNKNDELNFQYHLKNEFGFSSWIEMLTNLNKNQKDTHLSNNNYGYTDDLENDKSDLITIQESELPSITSEIEKQSFSKLQPLDNLKNGNLIMLPTKQQVIQKKSLKQDNQQNNQNGGDYMNEIRNDEQQLNTENELTEIQDANDVQNVNNDNEYVRDENAESEFVENIEEYENQEIEIDSYENEIANNNEISENVSNENPEIIEQENEVQVQESIVIPQVINRGLSHKKIMGEKLNIYELNLWDTSANALEDFPKDMFIDATGEMLPKAIFDTLNNGDNLETERFNNMYLEDEKIMSLLYVATKAYDEITFQGIYRYFHTLKGNFASFKMILASELFHKAAYLVQSINKQKRTINEGELQILQNIVQAALTLVVKIYYTYIRDAEIFTYYNEKLEKPLKYTLNVFAANQSIIEVHGQSISYTNQFREFVNKLGYELIDNDVYLIDQSIWNEQSNETPEIADLLSRRHDENVAQGQTSHEYVNNVNYTNETVNHYVNGNIEIHKQPIIIELEPQHYVANGIFIQNNDGYIVNQRSRVSIQDWIMACNFVLEEKDNMINYMQIMLGSYVGIADYENQLQYTIDNLSYSLNRLMNLCVTTGLHKSASLIGDYIELLNEYRDVNHQTFSVELYDEYRNSIGTREFNNFYIKEELNRPMLVVDPILVDFTIRIGEYLHYLFNHNPLDGLNKEDVELMKYQIKNHTEKCRNTIILKSMMLNEERRFEQNDRLTKLLSDSFTDMRQYVSSVADNNSTLMIAAQRQENSVSELISFVQEKVETQTTILDNNSNAISNITNGLTQIDVKINAIGQYVQSLLNGLTNSKFGKWIFKNK